MATQGGQARASAPLAHPARIGVVPDLPTRGRPMRQPRQAKALIRVEDERGQALTLPSGTTYPAGSRIKVETGHYRASIATAGYVSGVAAGSFVDTKTGARDLGFGLSIVDFLLEPADPNRAIPAGQYSFAPGIRSTATSPSATSKAPRSVPRPGG